MYVWWRRCQDDSIASPIRQLEETTRASVHLVAEYRPTWSESLQPHAEQSSRPGPEPSSAESDVYVWRYALLVVHARRTLTHHFFIHHQTLDRRRAAPLRQLFDATSRLRCQLCTCHGYIQMATFSAFQKTRSLTIEHVETWTHAAWETGVPLVPVSFVRSPRGRAGSDLRRRRRRNESRSDFCSDLRRDRAGLSPAPAATSFRQPELQLVKSPVATSRTAQIIPLSLPAYIRPCMLIILLVRSCCQLPICSLFHLFTFHLALAASALQLLKYETLPLQLFECVPGQTLFVASSTLTIPAGLPINLEPPFLHIRVFPDHCVRL